MKRKITSIILALCLCLGLASTAFAADNTAGKDRPTDADYMAMVILNIRRQSRQESIMLRL